MSKKIAILTSGGDAPGMNAAVRAVVRKALHYGFEVVGVRNGYRGLYNKDFVSLDRKSVAEIINRGGTFLGSSRFEELLDESVQIEIANYLKNIDIDALITIGGDGTYKGANALAKHGVPVIGIPGTIDNDIASSAFTIGFDTAVNTVVEAIDKLRDTSDSHERCSIVEVMGRRCGDIAIHAAMAVGAEYVVTSDEGLNMDHLIKSILLARSHNKRHAIVIVTEHICDVRELAKSVEDLTEYESRATILGYIQRGGVPSAQDRYLATMLGAFAIDLVLENKKNVTIGFDGLRPYTTPIEEAVTMKKSSMEYAKSIVYAIR